MPDDAGGWQSWSSQTWLEAWLGLPVFNFSPRGKQKDLRLGVSKRAKLKKPVKGWCSWYCFGWEIDERKILAQAAWMAKNRALPLDYVLIDGGWTVWGDWLAGDGRKFPSGMKWLAKSIKKLSLKPGIWLAPFLAHPKSEMAMGNPEWLVRENGRLVDGFKLTPWDGRLFYRKWILDIRRADVREYIRRAVEWLVEDCGFELLKLDFLYAVHFDPNLTEAEADYFLRDFLAGIKKRYPQVYTIASGCPLRPAVGVVDSMRVGPDAIVTPFVKFFPALNFINKYHHGQVMETVRKRLWTRFFWNVDPDALVCRKFVGLSDAQIEERGNLIREAAGNIFLGDDLTGLSGERIERFVKPLVCKSRLTL